MGLSAVKSRLSGLPGTVGNLICGNALGLPFPSGLPFRGLTLNKINNMSVSLVSPEYPQIVEVEPRYKWS